MKIQYRSADAAVQQLDNKYSTTYYPLMGKELARGGVGGGLEGLGRRCWLSMGCEVGKNGFNGAAVRLPEGVVVGRKWRGWGGGVVGLMGGWREGFGAWMHFFAGESVLFCIFAMIFKNSVDEKKAIGYGAAGDAVVDVGGTD